MTSDEAKARLLINCMADQTEDIAEIEESTDSVIDSEDLPPESTSKGSKVTSWLIAAVAVAIVITASGFGYLSSNGVDVAWAIGTSGWTAPPGATLAGRDIGGKSFDEITGMLDEFPGEFCAVSVWLVEESVSVSFVASEYDVSTVGDWIVMSVTPDEFGLSLDLNQARLELDALNDTASRTFAITDRVKLWKEPPEMPLRLAVDEQAVRDYLESVKSTVDCEPVDAALDLAARTIRSARDGMDVDVDKTLENLPNAVSSLDDVLVALAVNRTGPRVTDDAFDEINVEKPLGEYTTRFNIWKRNRSANIEMVAARFEGVVIQPGEVFSFNGTTGPRTFEEGYLAAPMYRNGRVEMSPGGGACQVSTTIYNAALLAGLEIVERYPHGRPCGYVPYGRDATVAYCSVDLKFKNTLEHPIILHQSVDRHSAGTITFEIYGHPDDRVHVEIGNAYSWLGRSESSTTYIIDRSLAPGAEVVEDEGTNGISQRCWRTWFDDAGNELYTEQISSDHVRSIGRLIRHNPDGSGESSGNEASPEGSSGEAPAEEPPPGIF
jgi:vancomycin resistance protein YoaR